MEKTVENPMLIISSEEPGDRFNGLLLFGIGYVVLACGIGWLLRHFTGLKACGDFVFTMIEATLLFGMLPLFALLQIRGTWQFNEKEIEYHPLRGFKRKTIALSWVDVVRIAWQRPIIRLQPREARSLLSSFNQGVPINLLLLTQPEQTEAQKFLVRALSQYFNLPTIFAKDYVYRLVWSMISYLLIFCTGLAAILILKPWTILTINVLAMAWTIIFNVLYHRIDREHIAVFGGKKGWIERREKQ